MGWDMSKKIDDYLKRLENLRGCIRREEEKRVEAAREYWKKIGEIDSAEAAYNAEIGTIKNTKIAARLTDIIGHLAEEWGTSVDNINLSHYTNCRTLVTNDQDFYDAVAKRLPHGGVRISYYITRKDLDAKDSAQNSITIDQKVIMDEMHADGKTFREHIVLQKEPVASSKFKMMDIGLDSYDNILIFAKLKDLTYASTENEGEYVSQTPYAKAMIAAAADYEAESKKEEMAD